MSLAFIIVADDFINLASVAEGYPSVISFLEVRSAKLRHMCSLRCVWIWFAYLANKCQEGSIFNVTSRSLHYPQTLSGSSDLYSFDGGKGLGLQRRVLVGVINYEVSRGSPYIPLAVKGYPLLNDVCKGPIYVASYLG